ncbi:HAD domain-containing protein [Trinickia mobilis]|uniref:HAD domain-containing protein n=1 Tax=Trinickia mobilis TaxID=2816356 RepID=UPI001A8D76D2|nr:HAD domain-containing protein [Trinickia mobilis]
MKDQPENWKLNPRAPTLYLGYGGVLHVGEGLIDTDGTISLDSGGRLFEFVPYLADLLAPYPDVQLILTTAWVSTLGEARTAELLPVELSGRVAGTTLRYPARMGEVNAGIGRTMSILRHAVACGIETWLAVGDDLYGVPSGKEDHFLRVPSDTALGTPSVRHALREWLAANATASRSHP